MKKSFFAVIVFFIGIFVLMGPNVSIAQSDFSGEPGRDLNQQEPGPGADSDVGRGAAPGVSEDNQARVSGEVVSVDPSTGMIEIQNDDGMVNSFKIEGDGRSSLNQVKKGDQVDLVIVFQAVGVVPQAQGRSSQQPSGAG